MTTNRDIWPLNLHTSQFFLILSSLEAPWPPRTLLCLFLSLHQLQLHPGLGDISYVLCPGSSWRKWSAFVVGGRQGTSLLLDGDTKREGFVPRDRCRSLQLWESGNAEKIRPHICATNTIAMCLVFMCRKGLQSAPSISLPVASFNASPRNSAQLDLG